jgi:predicted nucleotidyltransferase
VFLCGSVVEGLDDIYSDFDIRVVTDSPPSKETLIKKDIALSIWYLPRSAFDEAIEKRDYYHLRWIMNSIILFEKENYVTSLREKTLSSLEELVFDLYEEASIHYEDALGSLQTKDYLSSVTSARIAAGYTAQALLLSSGRYNLKKRWVARQLNELPDSYPGIARRYAEIEGIDRLDAQSTEQILARSVAFINDVFNQIIPASEHFLPIFGSQHPAASTSSKIAPTRHKLAIWLRYPDDSVLVSGLQGGIHKLNSEAGFVFQKCDGMLSEMDLIQLYARRFSLPADDAWKQVTKLIETLHQKGLLTS